MRNYVIINGINSNTIQGLAINILPPITKPMMRSQIEEIDGRDGDLITELGYSAYDKTMEIGLWGTYDIDAIIKYFTGEGTIIFSTEPDKYYYFKILNQIDYEKLLKFKKATVTFHCQPFKYPTSETPLEEAYEYVEATGTDITLDNTEETIFNKFDLIGNTSQETSTQGNQLIPFINQDFTINGIRFYAQNGNLYTNGTSTAYISSISQDFQDNLSFTLPAGTYYMNRNTTGLATYLYDITDTSTALATNSGSFTLSQTTTVFLGLYIGNGVARDNAQCNVMLNTGSTSKTYESFIPNMPSPNYPSTIHTVSGDNTIEVVGKNLLSYPDTTNTASGITFSLTNNNVLTYSGTASNTWANLSGQIDNVLVNGETYTFSIDTPQNVRIVLYETTPQVAHVIPAGDTYITFQSNGASKLFIGISGMTNNTSYSGTIKMQIESGESSSKYLPYSKKTYPINLGADNIINYLDVKGVGSRDGTDNVISGKTSISDDVLTISQTYSQGGAILKYNTITPPSVKAGEYITISFIPTVSITGIVGISNYNGGGTNNISMNQSFTANTKYTVTLEALSDYPKLGVFVQGSSATLSIKELMVERGKKVNSYTPYGEYIEMCSIPNTDYKDTFVHEDNKWYKYAMVGKVVLNGTEEIWLAKNSSPYVFAMSINDYKRTDENICLSDYFKSVVNGTYGSMTDGQIRFRYYSDSANNLYMCTTNYSNANDFKTWLGTNNTTVYYVLANPTQTEITDETLKAQLDDLWENAISYKGQTNITQTNNDLPFILDVSALKDGSDHLIIDNIGTAYSKPTIDIEGTGIVDIYLNDEQIFEIDMTNQNEIIIDTEKMEAYTPDNLLANRLVTGDYSNFKLASGENDLRFSGDLTKATVTRYIRWI